MFVPERLGKWSTSLTFSNVFLDKKWIFSNEAWLWFHIIQSNTQPLRYNASSSVSPCVPLRFVKRREWNEVTDNERQSLWDDMWSKHFSRVFFRLCCYLSEDAHKPNIRCDNVWKPQTSLKMLAEKMQTPDPHQLTRCCENGDGIHYQCLQWR